MRNLQMIKLREKLQQVLCEDWFNENIMLSFTSEFFTGNGVMIQGFDCEIDDEDMCITNNQNQEWIFKYDMIKSIEYEEDTCGNTICITFNNETVINLTSTTV